MLMPGGSREGGDDAEWERLVATTWPDPSERAVLGASAPPVTRRERRPDRRDRRSSGSLRTLWVTLVVVPLLVGGRIVAPHVSGWVDYLVNGDPTFRVGQGATPGAVPLGGRLRAAPPLPEQPSPDDYAYMDVAGPADPVAFDPCHAIHYVIHDPHGVGDAGRDIIAEAVAEVSDATGLAFVFDGYTDEKPSRSRGLRMPQYPRTWAPVLIAWSDSTETPRLGKEAIGLGGPRASDRPASRRTWVTGAIELDTPALARYLNRWGGDDYVRSVVVHELGHVLGANHPTSGDQLMSASGGTDSLQDGDRYAFAKLGRGPCLR
ncbi:hypothetical protein [Phycicoccus avicenniae]|uniref:hypothetical protein n=1 Tax=Phycicoccus avicenniae TaxID=2828860 RepID=UPI003D2AFAA2